MICNLNVLANTEILNVEGKVGNKMLLRADCEFVCEGHWLPSTK